LAGTYFQNAYNNAANTYGTNRQNTLYQLSALQNLAGIGTTANQQALSGAEYSGSAGLTGATTQAGLGMQGSQYSGNAGIGGATQSGNWGLQGQEAAMQAYMQGQAGAAAGVMGSANAWQAALGGVTNSANQAMGMQGMGSAMGGYGFGGGNASTPTWNPNTGGEDYPSPPAWQGPTQ
jgi:hypothetical protein